VAYGSIGLLSTDVLNVYQNRPAYESLLYQIGNVFAASGLIHFYLDGFIWKVRDAKVRQDLGMQAGGGFRERPKALHGILVGLFLVAAAALGASEYFHLNEGGKEHQSDNLAALVPASGYANFMKASRLKAAGEADSAIRYFERAIHLDSTFAFGHAFIGDLKIQVGDTSGALPHFRLAVALDPGDALLRGNLAHLCLRAGLFDEAKTHFLRLAEADPMNPEYPYQAAWSLLQMKKGLEARPHLEKSLALDPLQPLAWNYLGMIEQALGNPIKARDLYRKSLALDSSYVHARENLTALGP
jgi:tetratricopeptide (TPR) repeat protein